ncbi:hypothetical protein CW751_04350 [Brumimicrobium salinarum]|uniref:Uncharacterized protein n=1 Tax=Brumimicrobium salinarum TaxID=2058658 RepID=A0A2I0R3Z2_9FLAO|nr:hypothetical protein [Brumimicrobium salinarum]PKR81295.1 hypothetical protein CW751_04350 [Brumimicrobium salinarum]
MDSKVENIIDLGLVNYVRHPSNPNYVVFRFAVKKKADDFEQTLKSKKIWFEKGEENTRGKTYILFGIHNRDHSAVERINFQVEGRNRNFLIRNKFLRWSLLLFSIGVMTLAVVGYCTSPTLEDKMEEFQKVKE